MLCAVWSSLYVSSKHVRYLVIPTVLIRIVSNISDNTIPCLGISVCCVRHHILFLRENFLLEFSDACNRPFRNIVFFNICK